MAAHNTKRLRAIRGKLEDGKLYDLDGAIRVLQDCPPLKFVQTVEVSVNLGVDRRKTDQGVRGATILPHGLGKTVRVAVFARGDELEAAKQAGAEVCGCDDLAAQVRSGKMDFDLVIATPNTMPVVGSLGPILGPRGLMPNPKTGTVTTNVAAAVKAAKHGRVQFKTDRAGVVHCALGKLNFSVQALRENLLTLLGELQRLKPAASKGIYLRKVTLSTTMGPGLAIDIAPLSL